MESDQQKLLRIQAAKVRLLKYELYRKDPMLWLEEVFGEKRESFQWSLNNPELYDKHEWDGDVDPIANAWIALAEGKLVGIKAATATGKTYALSRMVAWFADCYEDSLIVTTAPSATQLKTNLWGEIQKASAILKRNARPFLEITSLKMYLEFHNKELDTRRTHMAIGEVSSAKNSEESAVKFQGYHRKHMLIILEEMAGIPPAVVTAALNTLDGSKTNLLIGVGNPDSELDQLSTFANLDYVASFRISAQDHPNVVTGETIFHGAVMQESINRRLVQYGEDSPLYLSRVRGITPTEGTNTLIRRAWVEPAFVDDDYTEEVAGGYNAVGVDVANSDKGDMAALCYGKAGMITDIFEFQCPNASHLAYNLLMDTQELIQNDYEDFNVPTINELQILDQCVAIDTVGVGASTMNVFQNYGLTALAMAGGADRKLIPFEERTKDGKTEKVLLWDFHTGRDQWYWELREDFRNGRIKMRISDPKMRHRIMIELCTPKFIVDKAKIAVESKGGIKKRLGGKSPNVADAIAYWNWGRKGYNIQGFGLGISGGGTK